MKIRNLKRTDITTAADAAAGVQIQETTWEVLSGSWVGAGIRRRWESRWVRCGEMRGSFPCEGGWRDEVACEWDPEGHPIHTRSWALQNVLDVAAAGKRISTSVI